MNQFWLQSATPNIDIKSKDLISMIFQNSIYQLISCLIRFNNYIIFKTYTKCIIALFFSGIGINCTTKSVHSKAKVQNIDYLIDQGELLWDQDSAH